LDDNFATHNADVFNIADGDMDSVVGCWVSDRNKTQEKTSGIHSLVQVRKTLTL
jgi:hypothetical protein